jgi:hypothetical protein
MAITQEQRAKLAAGLMRMLELQEKQATLVRAAISLLTQAEWHPAVRANQNQSLTTSGRSHPAAPLRECRKKLAQFRRPPADEHHPAPRLKSWLRFRPPPAVDQERKRGSIERPLAVARCGKNWSRIRDQLPPGRNLR